MHSEAQFAGICAVPDLIRRSGRSVVEVVQASDYAAMRGQFALPDLAAYLRARPDLIKPWIVYSQDKRTSEGWYLRPPYSIGRIAAESSPMTEVKHVDLAAACAAFIVAELGEVLDRAGAG